MVTHCWSSCYEELLALTNLLTLEKRRLHLKLSHLYKIVHHQSFFPDGIVLLREHSQFNSRSVHALTLQQPFAHTQSYYYSFVPHTISVWNTLPYEVTSSSSCAVLSVFCVVTMYKILYFFPYTQYHLII